MCGPIVAYCLMMALLIMTCPPFAVALCSDPPVLLPRIPRCAWSSRDNGTASERMPGWGPFVRDAGVRLEAWVCAS
jgi:hypothetical protein